jgi:endonuclease YncB( thermonuclease family)
MPTRQYLFKIVEVLKVTDGDTYWFRVDCGLRHEALVNIRLLGYDTPERTRGSAAEKQAAASATALAGLWLKAGMNNPEASLWVRTEPDPDNFGRWLGDVWLESDGDPWPERHLGAVLRETGRTQ